MVVAVVGAAYCAYVLVWVIFKAGDNECGHGPDAVLKVVKQVEVYGVASYVEGACPLAVAVICFGDDELGIENGVVICAC